MNWLRRLFQRSDVTPPVPASSATGNSNAGVAPAVALSREDAAEQRLERRRERARRRAKNISGAVPPSRPERVGSAEAELITVKSALATTLNASVFIRAMQESGFRYEDESPMGLLMQTEHSRLLLKVKGSIHPSNIATLVFMDKVSKKQTYLIDDGVKEY